MVKSYGFANLEHQIPNTPETKFRIGSLTKQITAATVLALAEQGKIGIDHKVSKYLPASPHAWDEITIRHLLTHTSGIQNFTSFKDNLKHERLPATPKQTVDRFINLDLNFAPGTDFGYSNSGYVLLGHIIERVTEKPFEDVVDALILQKAGMKDTGYDHPGTILSNRASGYAKAGDTVVNAFYFEMDTPFAAGALYSTVNDLFRWDRALRTGKILSQDSLKQMETPFFGNYGFGVSIEKGEVSHSGTISGFKAFMRRYPHSSDSVIVLSNYQFADPENISLEIARAALF